MFTVHKLTLSPFIEKFLLPHDAEILHFDWQGKNLCIWYKVSCSPEGRPLCVEKPVYLTIASTGLPINGGRYIGTAVSQESGLVFHLFQDHNYIEASND